jgi:DNA-binding LacI/PurR family transcriptional regulator
MKKSVDRARKTVVDAIIAREFPVGSLLPPVAELALRSSCSEATMQNALLNLAAQGIVSRVRKRGTVVERVPKCNRVGLYLSFDMHENQLLREQVYSRVTRAGYDVEVVYRTNDFASDLSKLERLTQGLEPIDRIVLLSPNEKSIADISKLFTHVIVWIFNAPMADYHSVRLDFSEAARVVAEYLLSLGHTKIGVAAGDDPDDSETFAAETYRTFRHLIEIKGGQCVPHYLAQQKLEDYADTHFVKGGITAYWSLIDATAVTAALICQKKGLRVPEDFSIIGRNDTPWCTAMQPHLTSLSINPEGVGDAVVKVLDGIANQKRERHFSFRVEPQLVIRESTAPAPK